MKQYLPTINRMTAALVGGYFCTWGFTGLGIVGLVALGMSFHEAEIAMLLFAFLVFLGLFLWTFAAANMLRVWAWLTGGGVVMTTAAWVIQRALLD